jgi:hypothetical protein
MVMVGRAPDSALLLALMCWVWGACGEEMQVEVVLVEPPPPPPPLPVASHTGRSLQTSARNVEAAANITLLDSVANTFTVQFQSRAKTPFEIASVRLELRVFDHVGGALLASQPSNPYASFSSSSPYLTSAAPCNAQLCSYYSAFTNLSTACEQFWEFALVGTLQCRTVSISVHDGVCLPATASCFPNGGLCDQPAPSPALPLIPQDGPTCSTTDVDTALLDSATDYPAPAWVTISTSSEIFVGDTSLTIAQCAESYTIPITASLSALDAPTAFIPGTDRSFSFRLYGVEESVDDYQFDFCDLTCSGAATVAYDCWTDLSATVGNPAQFSAPSGGDPFSSIIFGLTMPSFGSGSCELTVGASFDGALARRLEGTDDNMTQWEISRYATPMLRGSKRRAEERGTILAGLRLNILPGAAPEIFPVESNGAEPVVSQIEGASGADRPGSHGQQSAVLAILGVLVLLTF